MFQVGLPGFTSMPFALNMLSKHERASYCNHHWDNQFKKVGFFLQANNWYAVQYETEVKRKIFVIVVLKYWLTIDMILN